MKNQFFSFLTVVLISFSLNSCAKNCPPILLTNQQTGEQRYFPDNNCNGVADVNENTSTVSGTISFTGNGVIRNLSGTSRVGYANNGEGYAMTYGGTTDVSTQDRIISFQIPRAGGTVIKQALINQDLVTELQLASGELGLTNAVVDIFDRKDVSAMQQYINSDQKIIVIDYEGEPESTPLWSSKGADSYNHSTGLLNGHSMHYRVIGWHSEYVKNVFRVQ